MKSKAGGEDKKPSESHAADTKPKVDGDDKKPKLDSRAGDDMKAKGDDKKPSETHATDTKSKIDADDKKSKVGSGDKKPSETRATDTKSTDRARIGGDDSKASDTRATGARDRGNDDRGGVGAASVSSGTHAAASVHVDEQQRTRISQAVSRIDVQPMTNVNFQVSVGGVVPRDVRLHALSSDIVEIVPQYRGYSFLVVRDEIVIVEPSTYKIVTVIPRSGGSTAATTSRSKVSFTAKDREIVRKHVRAVPMERRTTGSTSTQVEIRTGERLPDTVEIQEFPETVYREAPTLREYRYIQRENRTYLVDPTERRVIEEID